MFVHKRAASACLKVSFFLHISDVVDKQTATHNQDKQIWANILLGPNQNNAAGGLVSAAICLPYFSVNFDKKRRLCI